MAMGGCSSALTQAVAAACRGHSAGDSSWFWRWFLRESSGGLFRLFGSRSRSSSASGCRQAVLVYVDLVTLARLANQSAPAGPRRGGASDGHPCLGAHSYDAGALQFGAAVPMGWSRRVSDEQSAELAELVEVWRLDDQGASLAGALRARVHEMRTLTSIRRRSRPRRLPESLTIWMVIPVLVLGLVLITPPLLIMAGSPHDYVSRPRIPDLLRGTTSPGRPVRMTKEVAMEACTRCFH